MKRTLALALAALCVALWAGEKRQALAEAGAADARVLTIVPLGKPDAQLVQLIAQAVRQRFTFSVRVAEPQPLPPSAWYAPRKRWRAEKLLDALDAMPLGDPWRVTGITERPISTTKGEVYDWGIAGLGTLDGKSCVLTAHLFSRFKKSAPGKYRRYMKRLVLHEVGHTLGLHHCPLERCIMADAKGNAVRSAQRSSDEFCPRCFGRIKQHLRSAAVQGQWSGAERALLDGDGDAPTTF